MATLANIVINDGAGTPNARTFVPSRRDGTLVVLTEKSAGVAAGFRQLSILSRTTAQRDGTTKVTVKIVDPRLAVTAPASGSGVQPNPTTAYSTLVNIEFVLPNPGDAQSRLDILAFAKNALANAIVADAITGPNAPV